MIIVAWNDSRPSECPVGKIPLPPKLNVWRGRGEDRLYVLVLRLADDPQYLIL